jgi:hypothetical protein
MDWISIPIGARWGDIAVFDIDELKEIAKTGRKNEHVLVQMHEPMPTKRVKCKCCNIFRVHSSPPEDFTEEQKEYCCAYCGITGGKRHGERCERRK